MKSRRFLCALLTLLMAAALCGCSQPALKIASKAEFETAMESCLDLSHYTYDSGSARYELNDAYIDSSKNTLDFTVSFKSSQPITLPLAPEELESSGWTKASKSLHVLYDTYSNSSGESIIVDVSDSLFMPDTSEHTLIIQTYSISDLKEDFTYDLLEMENAPDFVIGEKINSKSRISDVINVLGEPWSVTYQEDATIADVPAVQLLFGAYEDGEFVGTLQITFAGETEEILEIRYTYLQRNS